MVAALSRTRTLALATARDLVRRPGALLAIIATGTLLLMLPRLARRALDDGSALSVELILSTITLHVTIVAAIAGARAAAPDTGLGPSTELFATPLRPLEYILARAGGVSLAALLHGLALLFLGAAALLAAGDAIPADEGMLTALVGAALQVLIYAAAGLAAGSLLGAQLGTVAIVLFLVAARVVIPAATAAGAAGAWWLPDPARLDFSREAGFARSVGTAALAAAAGAALAQTAALLALARCAFARDARGRERDS